MADYMLDHHVLDDYDDFVLEPATMDDDMNIERRYQYAPPAVYNTEAPPPLRIKEDCRMEAQYSEESGDEDDTVPQSRDYSHITQMLRQVEPEEFCDERSILNGILKSSTKSPVLEENFTVILQKTALNPQMPEFVPKSDSGSSNANTVNSGNESPKSVKSLELEKCQIDRSNRSSKVEEKGRNCAIESLRKLRELEKTLLIPEYFLSSTSPNPQPFVPVLTLHPPTGPISSRTTVLQTSKNDILLTKIDEPVNVNSQEEPRKNPATPKKNDQKKKKSKEFVPSEKTTKLYEKYSQLDKQKENEKIASRTSENNLNAFIKVKLEQHELQKKEGRESGVS